MRAKPRVLTPNPLKQPKNFVIELAGTKYHSQDNFWLSPIQIKVLTFPFFHYKQTWVMDPIGLSVIEIKLIIITTPVPWIKLLHILVLLIEQSRTPKNKRNLRRKMQPENFLRDLIWFLPDRFRSPIFCYYRLLRCKRKKPRVIPNSGWREIVENALFFATFWENANHVFSTSRNLS